jgi:oligoendopeptidase F
MSNLFFKRKKNIWFFYLIFIIILIMIAIGLFFRLNPIFRKTIAFKGEAMTKEKTGNTDIVDGNVENDFPSWNLNDLYSGINDTKIEKDLVSLEKKIVEFNKSYLNQVRDLSGYELFKAMVKFEEINEIMAKLTSFAYLKYAENLSIEENVIFYQRISELITKFSADIVFFSIEINELDDEELDYKLKDSSNLQKYYKRYIEVLRLFKKHQLSVELEKILTEKSITSSQAWSRLFDETVDNMKFKFKNKELNESQIMEVINGKDEKDRIRAGKVFGEKLGENIKLLAFITNILAKDKSIGDKWRNFSTPISSRNLSNLIEDEVVDNLYNSVQKNYRNISHRYYTLKAKIFKKNKLHYTDRNAPLPFDDDKKYTWDEAVSIVLDAYGKFSPEMAKIGKLFFENNWVDVPTRAGKRGGAFAHPTVPTVHPYLLLNFRGRTEDIITLAHELGHGIHMYLANKQGYFMSDTPLTLAETASVFGEQLVFRYLLENETDKNKKIAIIANKIEDMINTVVRQTAFLKFEKIVHDERKNGEITVDRLNEIWIDVQKESLGEIFVFDDEYKYYWSYIPHFIHSPFYVYSYAFGDCLVNSLYSSYLSKPENFQKKYIDLLTAGGSKDYKELLKPFDLDPKDPNFWQRGMDLIIELIDELESMLATEN